ncbi:CAP domain-containing protein [Granulicella cerasi]|uniref:CAP domain-containing protein n=1 Tax=Granulicella cerasi TaxID=741063 RepID=A0ABW1ZGH4_9BACT|nr:CAP domain-containing protein [Granulicella cerasi]
MSWASVCAAQGTVSERYLFAAVNAERIQRGLPELRWDDQLYRAAEMHARQMAEHRAISHQFTGESDLAARGQLVGAHFSTIAENVAMAPTAVRIHDAWMNSPHHRDNILDRTVDSVAIRVLARDGELYAVEDFDRSVAGLSLDEQEQQVGALVHHWAPGMLMADDATDARATCARESGYVGDRMPWFVMRFTSSNLTQLPEQLTSKLKTGKYKQAAIGACAARGNGAFTAFQVAVLLYP